MNPEFKRNIWQEFSKQRLIAMPAILLAIFFIVYLRSGFSDIPDVAETILFLLLVVWGSGLSADAVFEEIREHTWDAQRMTPLGPWSMAWGKLFGSTLFVWYGALWCLLAIGYSTARVTEMNLAHYSSRMYQSNYYILIGIFTQAFALFIALLFQRINPLRTRAKVVLIQLFAIAVALILSSLWKMTVPEMFNIHTWYDLNITQEQFILGSEVFLCGSLIFGIYRLLRAELQIRNFPWGWPLFILIWIGYLWGFLTMLSEIEISADGKKAIYCAIAYLIALMGTFLSAFFAPKNIVHYFRWWRYLKEAQFKRSLTLTPPWMVTIIFAFLLVFPLVFFLYALRSTEPNMGFWAVGLTFSLFFFLIRDLGLLYYLTFDFHAKRAHLATIVYLIALYTLLPMLLAFTGLPSYWFPAFAPWSWAMQAESVTWTQIAVLLFLVMFQAVASWSLVVGRWREVSSQLA